MILDRSTLNTIDAFLCDVCSDVTAADGIAQSVVRVLEHGNEKHPDDMCHPVTDLICAQDHYLSLGNEDESGEPHKAHTLARCLLAIKKIMEGPWD